MASCENCIHFKRAPYEANLTGCWHPDNMQQNYSEAFLCQQQMPGKRTDDIRAQAEWRFCWNRKPPDPSLTKVSL